MTEIPVVKESTKFNFFTSIWIVPAIAVLISFWLAYQHYSKVGSEIKIHFVKNNGLKAGESQIRYKEIPIGKVTNIQLQENGKGVTVIANIEKQAANLLNENTKFWIVKPQIGPAGISGLETLFSGNYIDMHKGNGKKTTTDFIGLKDAYKETNGGKNFELTTTSTHNLKVGAPIYYKAIQIGQVQKIKLSENGQLIRYLIFVKKEYISYVHIDSNFSVQSMVQIGFKNGALNFDIAPLPHLISGSITLHSPSINKDNRAPDNYVFKLYNNQNSAKSYQLGQGGKFLKTFEIVTTDPTINLRPGSHVKYSGYPVGRVKSIKPFIMVPIQQIKSKILLEIDLSAFANPSEPEAGKSSFYQAVTNGLRAKISSSIPVVGDLFVDLVFDKTSPKQSVLDHKPFAILPVTNASTDLLSGIQKIIDKVSRLPLEELLSSANNLIDDNSKSIKEILANLNLITKNVNTISAKSSFQNMPDDLQKTMTELRQTLHSIKKISDGSGKSILSDQITQTLKIINKTSREMKEFLRLLNNKPNSLIFGDK